MSKSSKAARDNRANQMNPNNAAYHSSRQGSGDAPSAADGQSEGPTPATPDAGDRAPSR